MVLRAHEERDGFVVDAAVRSWPPIAPRCLRWQFPVFVDAPDLDPTRLKPDRPRRPKAPPVEKPAPPPIAVFDAERFADELVGPAPVVRATVLERAKAVGLSQAQAQRLLSAGEAEGAISRLTDANRGPHRFASATQPQLCEVHNERNK